MFKFQYWIIARHGLSLALTVLLEYFAQLHVLFINVTNQNSVHKCD